MADVENVIKAWNCCNPFNRKCKECPYEKDCYHDGISRHMVADAIELLKSQQAEIERLKVIAQNGNGFIEKCDSRTAQMFSH